MELSIEQKRALALAAARKRMASAGQPDTSGVLPQALSGANEGVANFLSLPNNLIGAAEMGLRSIGPGIGNMLGGDFAMPTEPMLKLPDAGESYRKVADEFGAIKPETDDPAGRFARRVGEEVGANLIPALGTPAKVAALLSSAGGGIGAATAEAVAPDNAGAELLGQTVGSFTPVGAMNAVERSALRKVAPSVDDLKTQAGSLYDAAEARGVTFAQPSVKRVADDIAAQAISDGLDPTLHPGATAALKRIQEAGATGMTVKDAQTMRRVLAAAAKDPMNPDQARIAGRMVERFDAFIEGAAPELAQARGIYRQAKKGELIEHTIELARSKAGQYSQSGMENALRTEFRALERKIIKGQLKGLSEEEIAAIRKVAQGGPVENILRYVGKLAPTGPVSLAVSSGVPFAVGSAFAGPAAGAAASAATMGTGYAALKGAEAMTMRNADVASALMRRGGQANVPLLAPDSAAVSQALLLGQAANQNAPRNSVSDALRRPSQARTR